MSSMPGSLARRRAPREQVVVGACDACGSPRAVMPCSNADCDAWVSVCDCREVSETSYTDGDRCDGCRALPWETAEAWEHKRRTSRGTFHAHRAGSERRSARDRRATKGGIL